MNIIEASLSLLVLTVGVCTYTAWHFTGIYDMKGVWFVDLVLYTALLFLPSPGLI